MNYTILMNYAIYISLVKPEGQALGLILRRSLIFLDRRLQSDKEVGNYRTSRGVRTWRIFAQVITGDLAASSSLSYTEYTACVVTAA